MFSRTEAVDLIFKSRACTAVPVQRARTLDAEDIVFSFNRLSEIGSNRRLFAHSVSPNAAIESVTAPDDKTVVLNLAFPSASLLSTLATFTAGSFYVVPRESDGGIDLRTTQLGSGPFMLSEYSPSQQYVYKRNEGYYDVQYTFVDGTAAADCARVCRSACAVSIRRNL